MTAAISPHEELARLWAALTTGKIRLEQVAAIMAELDCETLRRLIEIRIGEAVQ